MCAFPCCVFTCAPCASCGAHAPCTLCSQEIGCPSRMWSRSTPPRARYHINATTTPKAPFLCIFLGACVHVYADERGDAMPALAVILDECSAPSIDVLCQAAPALPPTLARTTTAHAQAAATAWFAKGCSLDEALSSSTYDVQCEAARAARVNASHVEPGHHVVAVVNEATAQSASSQAQQLCLQDAELDATLACTHHYAPRRRSFATPLTESHSLAVLLEYVQQGPPLVPDPTSIAVVCDPHDTSQWGWCMVHLQLRLFFSSPVWVEVAALHAPGVPRVRQAFQRLQEVALLNAAVLQRGNATARDAFAFETRTLIDGCERDGVRSGFEERLRTRRTQFRVLMGAFVALACVTLWCGSCALSQPTRGRAVARACVWCGAVGTKSLGLARAAVARCSFGRTAHDYSAVRPQYVVVSLEERQLSTDDTLPPPPTSTLRGPERRRRTSTRVCTMTPSRLCVLSVSLLATAMSLYHFNTASALRVYPECKQAWARLLPDESAVIFFLNMHSSSKRFAITPLELLEMKLMQRVSVREVLSDGLGAQTAGYSFETRDVPAGTGAFYHVQTAGRESRHVSTPATGSHN